MDLVIFEEKIKYDRLVKVFINLVPLIFVSLFIIFYIDLKIKDLLPGQAFRTENDFYLFSFIMALVAFIYYLFLPKSVLLTREELVIKFPAFSWKIPFNQIKAVREKRGIIYRLAFKWYTSKKNAILIERKRRAGIVICVENAPRFIEVATSLLEEWRRYHPTE
ncbi:MAG: hypothetical protein N3B16_00545 [Candidatus Aminicenantes bacterium]|nr:hypothetical protein [Candidatus Aminicenantes bacterium]